MTQSFNESQFIFKFEQEFAKGLRYALQKLGGQYMFDPHFESRSDKLPHVIVLGGKGPRGRRKSLAIFKEYGYRGGEVIEGKRTTFESVLDGHGWERTIEAPLGGSGIVEHIEDAKELTNRESEAWNVNARFEVTNKTSIKASASLGDIARAEASSETTVTASTEFGAGGTSLREHKRSHKIGTELRAKPGQTVQATVDVSEKKVVTPITQIGLLDFVCTIDFYDWSSKYSWHLRGGIWDRERYKHIDFDSRQQVIDFFRGRNEREFPNMKHFVWDMLQAKNKGDAHARRAHEFVLWLEEDDNFQVELQKERVQTYQNAGTLRVKVLEDLSIG